MTHQDIEKAARVYKKAYAAMFKSEQLRDGEPLTKFADRCTLAGIRAVLTWAWSMEPTEGMKQEGANYVGSLMNALCGQVYKSMNAKAKEEVGLK